MKALFPYAETTRGLTVRVVVNFLPEQSEPQKNRWFWAYHIRIENDGEMPVQLISRRWEITDARGAMNLVEGDGVIGEQPVIKPGTSFDYVSGCPLSTPSGEMIGWFAMMGADGSYFDIAVPRFALNAPVVRG
jgi:ApaG protein